MKRKHLIGLTCFFLALVLFLLPATANTPQDLESYLNSNFTVYDTPMGQLSLTHTVMQNTLGYSPHDYWIQSDYLMSDFFPYDIQYSTQYSQEQKQDTIQILKQIQMSIYQAAAGYFPNSKIRGGYYHGGYEYPYLQVGYYSTSFLSWQNYSGSRLSYQDSYMDQFHWDSTIDDYDFTGTEPTGNAGYIPPASYPNNNNDVDQGNTSNTTGYTGTTGSANQTNEYYYINGVACTKSEYEAHVNGTSGNNVERSNPYSDVTPIITNTVRNPSTTYTAKPSANSNNSTKQDNQLNQEQAEAAALRAIQLVKNIPNTPAVIQTKNGTLAPLHVLQSLGSLSVNNAKSIIYRNITTRNGIDAISIDIDASQSTKGIYTSAYMDSVNSEKIKRRFASSFNNQIVVIELAQEEDYGQYVDITIHSGLSELKGNSLYIYSYNPRTNRYRLVDRREKAGDRITFTTFYADYILITDSPL